MPLDGWIPILVVPFVALTALVVGAVRPSGALAGLFVGLALSWGLGWAGFAMLATLVAIGTLVSERGSRKRDAVQVFSNGGVAALAALAAAAGWEWGGAAAAGALAAALSDTVASEWGRRFGGEPRLMLLGPRVKSGRDGGMTWLGTCAGVCFAWPVPLVSMACGGLASFGVLSKVAAAGFAANLVDSALGVRVQKRLGPRGNDWVNLLATLGGAAMAALG